MFLIFGPSGIIRDRNPIFIARQADSHESLEFPIRANHAAKTTKLPKGPSRLKILLRVLEKVQGATRLGATRLRASEREIYL